MSIRKLDVRRSASLLAASTIAALVTHSQVPDASAVPSAAKSTVTSSRANKSRRFLGPVQEVGNGKARSFVVVNRAGQPTQLGLIFTRKALSGLPDTLPETEYTLPLPQQVAVPPFDHLTMSWNPHGHPPEDIYDEEHFDLHFYMISQQQRDLILPNVLNGEQPPASQFIPQNYFPIPGIVPRMGVHWLDATSPELNGGPFNSTFIYGFFQGDLIFLEPMVSLALLQTKPNVTLPISQPQAFARTGYYPTSYTISYQPRRREYTISLNNLIFHTGVTIE